jgi:hypothetical protein
MVKRCFYCLPSDEKRLYRNHYADVRCGHLTVVEKAQSLDNALIFLNSLLGLHSANDRPRVSEQNQPFHSLSLSNPSMFLKTWEIPDGLLVRDLVGKFCASCDECGTVLEGSAMIED